MANGASKGAMTKIFTYSRTMKSTSDYATNMKRLSAQIFGEVGQRIRLIFLNIMLLFVHTLLLFVHTLQKKVADPSALHMIKQLSAEPREQSERFEFEGLL